MRLCMTRQLKQAWLAQFSKWGWVVSLNGWVRHFSLPGDKGWKELLFFVRVILAPVQQAQNWAVVGGRFWAWWAKSSRHTLPCWSWSCGWGDSAQSTNLCLLSFHVWLFDRFTSCIVNASWSGAKKTVSLFFNGGCVVLTPPIEITTIASATYEL